MSVCVKETSCKLVAHMYRRRLSEKAYCRVGRNAFGSREDLKSDEVSLGLYYLGKSAVHNGKLVI